MVLAVGYEGLGPFDGVPERFRRDAVTVAQKAAGEAFRQVFKIASDAADNVETSLAVTPSAAAVSRGGISAVQAVASERRFARLYFGFWALFATLPAVTLAGVAAVSLANDTHASSYYAILVTISISLILGIGLWPGYGRPGFRTLCDIRTKGYVGDHLPGNIGILAGKCWLPGDRALYICHLGLGSRAVPYYEIGLVSVVRDNDGLHSAEVCDCSGRLVASIVPPGDGSRANAEALARTIRLKTMAALVI